jgi:hypothetical protein
MDISEKADSLWNSLVGTFRQSLELKSTPKRDCHVSLIGNHPLLAVARPSGTSLTAYGVDGVREEVDKAIDRVAKLNAQRQK